MHISRHPRHDTSPHTQATIPAVHSIVVTSPTIQSIFDRLVLVIDEGLARPISCNVDIGSRKDYFQQNEDEIVDDGAEAEKLPSPDTTAIVPFQTVDQGIALNASFSSSSTPACSRVMAIEFLLVDCSRDAIIDPFCSLRHIEPRIHHLDLVVKSFRLHSARAHSFDRLPSRVH